MAQNRGRRVEQVRFRHYDYTALNVPAIGEWEPKLAVSVVIPVFNDQERLQLALASIAGQTYPSHLIEAVVVDDGSSPPVVLPEVVPENIKIISSEPTGWGSAHAVQCGVSAAEGDVILRLDSDMLIYREHVEAHARWHHFADYLAVIGMLTFVDYAAGELSPLRVLQAVTDGEANQLFPAERAIANSWVERIIENTNNLIAGGNRAFRIATGASISFTPRLNRDSGGMDAELVLGGDTEFGYRLAQAGAVFVPEHEAKSWHLGISQMKGRNHEGRRFRAPFLSQRVPLLRDLRKGSGRQWKVPYVDVVVEVGESNYEEVRATVAGALASALPDVGVTIVGPWSKLTGERRAPLDDPELDLRLIREAFAHDGRVRLSESVPATSAPAPFRFKCPPGLVPTPDSLSRLIDLTDKNLFGMILLPLPRSRMLPIARLERTEAVSRALAVREATEGVEDVISEIFGVHWLSGTEWGLVSADGEGVAPTVVALPAEVKKYQDEAQRQRERAERFKADALKWRANAEKWNASAQKWKAEATGGRRILNTSVMGKIRRVLRRQVVRLLQARRAADRNG